MNYLNEVHVVLIKYLICIFVVIKICFTGGLGQLGIECAKLLRTRYGNESVILSDIVKPSDDIMENGPYIFCDILDFKVTAICCEYWT